jgi:hypothetical protein
MKRINLAVLVVFCISLFAIQCSQDSNPVGPGVSTQTQSGDAVLLGNFITSGIENCLSFIDVADIQSGEEIRMQLQIQENNCVMLQHMNRNKKSAETLPSNSRSVRRSGTSIG